MKLFQLLWSEAFLFGPAIYLMVVRGFWVGLLALGGMWIASTLIGWGIVLSGWVPVRHMALCGYVKCAFVGIAALVVGLGAS